MRLAVDANVLVGELTRTRGRVLIAHDALELLIAEKPWSEAPHELRKRLFAREQQGRLVPGTVEDVVVAAVALATEHMRVIEAEAYAPFEEEARERIPRDPDDWPTIALALASDAEIWTHDGDFLGCGVATWTTDVLMAYLARRYPVRDGDATQS